MTAPPPRTVGDLLASRRRSRFVGREAELRLFRGALAAAEPPFAVLYVHGPGGVGKTALLDALGDLAEAAGATVARLDCRDLVPLPAAVSDAIRTALGADDAEELTAVLSRTDRPVLLLDTYERLEELDEWVRTTLLPCLPVGAVTVLAGRTPPATAWRADPAWRDLLHVVALRNLRREETRKYLSAAHLPGDVDDYDWVHHVTYGHPLALSLMADVIARGGNRPEIDTLAPDVVNPLLQRFIDVVPGEAQRRALGVCAIARVTTEALLREAIGGADAHELFVWLRGLSFIETGLEGLFPHDVARDALTADLRLRDPDSYERVFRSVTTHIIGRLKATTGREQQRVLFDAKYLHRYQPLTRSWYDWDTIGKYFPEPARPEDLPAMLSLIERWEGAESATIAGRWFERQPQGFYVVRRPDGGVHGLVAQIDLTAATPGEIHADPGARAAWSYVARTAPVRLGETVTQSRFLVDSDAYQNPSPTVNTGPVLSIQHWLSTPLLAWSFITLADVEAWQDYFAFFDIHRAQDADFSIGGHRYGIVGHDFRQMGVEAWLSLMFERDLSGDDVAPAAVRRPLVVLSRPDFDAAVRQALRALQRPDLVATNPLMRSRLVRAETRNDLPDPGVLVALVRAAAESLRGDPRDEKLFRVIDRTYLRPAATQELAAELLGLPPTTYKRHLRHAVDRVIGWLWEREMAG